MWVDCDAEARRENNADRDVDDTPDATLSVLFEHGSDLRGVGEVASMGVDHRAVLFFVGRLFRKGGLCDLIETSESGGKRVVVVIDGNNFVFACLLESEDDVRSFGEGQWSVERGGRQNANQYSQPRL